MRPCSVNENPDPLANGFESLLIGAAPPSLRHPRAVSHGLAFSPGGRGMRSFVFHASHATAADLDLLTSHGPANQTAEYISRQMQARSPELREAQRKISTRLLTLMGGPRMKFLESGGVPCKRTRLA
jgi:hypothetical protein